MSAQFIKTVLDKPYGQQLRHWGTPRPWVHGGRHVKLKRPEKLTSRDVTVDAAGNLTRIKALVHRPCFGSPIAFLWHRDEGFYMSKGKAIKARCHSGRCDAAEACAHVAKARLRSTPEIRDALDKWESAGGLAAMKRDFREGQVGRPANRWRDLLSALEKRGQFRCTNTDQLRAYVDARYEAALKVDAKRKRKARAEQRLKRIRANEEDKAFLDRLWRETKWRRHQHEAARAHPCAPPWLTRCPPDGSRFDAEVWRSRVLIEARGQAPTPGSIAQYLIEQKLVETDNVNALRNGRVKAALDRIHKLESHLWLDGRPVWPPVDLAELLEPEDPIG
jgi:hypothetical protein